jgi:hypothetical protein
VKDAIDEDGQCDEKKAEGLIAAEEAALFVAASGALLLNIQRLQAIVHSRELLAGRVNRQYSGGVDVL